jgi:hypothetical protein
MDSSPAYFHDLATQLKPHMDSLILGETIRGKSPQLYYGFWMPAQGNDGAGGIEIFAISASKFTAKLQTKTAEDVDPAASSNIIGSAALSATGVTRFAVSNAKELVRYIVTADDLSVDQYMHFQCLVPQWAAN